MSRPKKSRQLALAALPGGVSLDLQGVRLPDKMPFQKWLEVGVWLGRSRRGLVWAVAEWLNRGEDWYSEEFSQGIEALGQYSLEFKPEYLMNLCRVERKFPRGKRHMALPLSFHQDVLSLVGKDGDMTLAHQWLTTCEEKGWTREEFREALKAVKPARKKGEKAPVLPGVEDDPDAEWFALTTELVDTKDAPDLKRALMLGRDRFGVKRYAEVVSHWAREYLVRMEQT